MGMFIFMGGIMLLKRYLDLLPLKFCRSIGLSCGRSIKYNLKYFPALYTGVTSSNNRAILI